MDRITSRFKKILNYSVLVEVVDLVVGLLLFLKVFDDLKITPVIVGTVVLVHGLFSLIRYFYDGLASRFFATDLIMGVAGVILGLFLIFNPFDSFDMFGTVFAIWLLLVGLHRLYYGIRLIKLNDEIYPLICMIGLLIVIMGCLLIFNPFEGFEFITRLLGIFILVNMAFEVMTLRLYKIRTETVLDMFD